MGVRSGIEGVGQRNALRHQIAERDGGWECRYCSRQLYETVDADDPAFPELDHVIPLRLGGTNTLGNLVLACRACNRCKADTIVDPPDWIQGKEKHEKFNTTARG